MPEVDYSLLADYVRPDVGIAHVIAAGIDTITVAQVPAGQNIGLLLRVSFTRQECDREHRIEIIFQDADGARLVRVDSSVRPQWDDGLPPGWRQGLLVAFNLGVPLPHYGVFSFEILVNDNALKSMPVRVVPPLQAP